MSMVRIVEIPNIEHVRAFFLGVVQPRLTILPPGNKLNVGTTLDRSVGADTKPVFACGRDDDGSRKSEVRAVDIAPLEVPQNGAKEENRDGWDSAGRRGRFIEMPFRQRMDHEPVFLETVQIADVGCEDVGLICAAPLHQMLDEKLRRKSEWPIFSQGIQIDYKFASFASSASF